MMREKARSSPRCAFRRTPRSGWVSGTGRRSIARVDEILPRHLYGISDTKEGKDGRSEICELPAVADGGSGLGDDERNRVRRVGRLRAAVPGDELLRVAVVGRDQGDAAGRRH